MPRGGTYRHLVTFQTLDPAVLAVSSLTRAGTVATVVTSTPHGFASEDRVQVAGAAQGAYNGTVVVAVLNPSTFTYPVTGDPATPATGTISALYVSDRLGGQRRQLRNLTGPIPCWWHTLTVRDRERLQADQVTAPTTHAINLRWRTGLSPKLLAVVSHHLGAGETETYEIESVINFDGRRRELQLLCVRRQEQAA